MGLQAGNHELPDEKNEPNNQLGNKAIDFATLTIAENALADTILNQLMHKVHRLQLKGESMRKIIGKLVDDEDLD